jgi:2'-5' RNA ligase
MIHSIWLLPAAEHTRILDALISELAPIFGTSPFPAHTTIQGDLPMDRNTLETVCAGLVREVAPFSLQIEGIAISPAFFRSFYLGFAQTQEFDSLQRASANAVDTREGLAPFPHLSLAYGNSIGAARKEELRRLHERNMADLQAIRFDRLALVRSAKEIPIAAWQVFDEYPLRES